MAKERSSYIFNCGTCKTPCNAISKGNYPFEKDLRDAEQEENILISLINQSGTYRAEICQTNGYPDIRVLNNNAETIQYLEVKMQRRAFMKIHKMLPDAQLHPSETVALNLSDLLRYFNIYAKEKLPISVMWVLKDRPCITGKSDRCYFAANISILQKIYRNDINHSRRFRRRSGEGDVINGKHLGVTVNYHFLLSELKAWSPDNLKF